MPAAEGAFVEEGPLTFEVVRFPDEVSRLNACDARIDKVSRSALADAASSEDGRCLVIVGARKGRTELLAPCLYQVIGLPIKLGERVLRNIPIPTIRLTPVAQEGVHSERDAVALLEWLRSSDPRRAVVLTDVSTESPLHAAVLRAGRLGYRLTKEQPVKHLFHRLSASYSAFFDERSSKYKNQLRRRERIFRERFGEAFELREYRRPGEVSAFLGAASRISEKTYQARLFGERVDNDEQSDRIHRAAAEAGTFRSFVLWHDATPLCFVLGHQRPDGTFEHRQTGFDPEWRDFGPGIVCNILMLQRLYADDRPQMLDFGSGDAEYKRLFANESRFSANPVLIPRIARYYVPFELHRAATAFNEVAVRLLTRWGVKDAIKRRLRRLA